MNKVNVTCNQLIDYIAYTITPGIKNGVYKPACLAHLVRASCLGLFFHANRENDSNF